MSDDDLLKLNRPKLTEKDIAEALRSGPSAAFCNALAAMLDPIEIKWKSDPVPGKDRPTHKKASYRLRLVRPDKSRPKGSLSHDEVALGSAMLALDELPSGHAKAPLDKLLSEFNVSKRTAEAAKAKERERREIWGFMEEREQKSAKK